LNRIARNLEEFPNRQQILRKRTEKERETIESKREGRSGISLLLKVFLYLYFDTEGAQGADSAPLPVSLLKPQEMTADIHNSDSCQPATVQRHNKNKTQKSIVSYPRDQIRAGQNPAKRDWDDTENPSNAFQSLQCGDGHLRRG